MKYLKGLLGVINYFKKLVPDKSEIKTPLIKLLKIGVKWNWGEEQENAFNKIKQQFANNLRLFHPQYDKPFILKTDASLHTLAGVLVQEQDDIELPVRFVSRLTQKQITLHYQMLRTRNHKIIEFIGVAYYYKNIILKLDKYQEN